MSEYGGSSCQVKNHLRFEKFMRRGNAQKRRESTTTSYFNNMRGVVRALVDVVYVFMDRGKKLED